MTETILLIPLLFLLLSPFCDTENKTNNESLLSTTTIIVPSSTSNTTDETSTPPGALLVQIYDSHSNLRHHHHTHPWGPHFEENNALNVTVREGQNTLLDCRVGLIEDKTISWVRRKAEFLDLLTLGTTNHSSDSRISSDFKYPNNWRLSIKNSTKNDTGTYLCQISTHPPKSLIVQLNVEAPEVYIGNTRGEMISEVHYKEGSTLQLICSANNVRSKTLNWFRNKDLLNHDVSRGGVSIKSDMTTEEARSTLQVFMLTKKDSGIYLCSAPPFNATVTVHVLSGGENPAELYYNHGKKSLLLSIINLTYFLVPVIIIFLYS